MKQLILSLVAALVGALLIGCAGQQQNNISPTVGRQTPASPKPSNPDGHDHAAESAVPRINVTEAEAAVKRGEAVFLDVRQTPAYTAGHIKGTITMPEAEIPSRAGTLPRDKKIITYCA